jgi:hypothetical protein
MRTIHKFPLEITDEQGVSMPVGAELLAVAEQNGQLVLWAEVFPNNPNESKVIRVVGTGNPFPDHLSYLHIGTVVMSNGFVWHVYEKKSRFLGSSFIGNA